MPTFLLFAIGVTMGSFGGVCFRLAGTSMPAFTPHLSFFVKAALNPFLVLGFFLYLLPALIWVYLLGKYPISFVQPILALTYVLTPVLGILILKEPVPAMRWVGILVIIVGVIIVSRTKG